MVLSIEYGMDLSSGPYRIDGRSMSNSTYGPARVTAVLAGLAGMGCVGGGVAVSGELADAPLFTTQAVRYSLAAVLLVCAARVAGRRVVRPRGAEWAWLTGVAALGLVLFNVALVRGSAHAEPAVLGVAVACVPVVLAIADPLLGGRRPRPAVLVAAAVVTAGAVLVQGGGRADTAGLAWAVIVLVCEVGFTLLAVPVLGRHGPWGVAVHSCWLAAVVLWVLGATSEGLPAALTLRPAHLLVVGYLAVVLTALAFVLWYSAVAGLGSARAGLLTGVAPVAAVGVGVLLGVPVPGITVWAGIALVGLGLAVGLRRPAFERPRSRPSPERFAASRA
jgi:drug/metabolite transporter (DMT)-like permease